VDYLKVLGKDDAVARETVLGRRRGISLNLDG